MDSDDGCGAQRRERHNKRKEPCTSSASDHKEQPQAFNSDSGSKRRIGAGASFKKGLEMATEPMRAIKRRWPYFGATQPANSNAGTQEDGGVPVPSNGDAKDAQVSGNAVEPSSPNSRTELSAASQEVTPEPKASHSQALGAALDKSINLKASEGNTAGSVIGSKYHSIRQLMGDSPNPAARPRSAGPSRQSFLRPQPVLTTPGVPPKRLQMSPAQKISQAMPQGLPEPSNEAGTAFARPRPWSSGKRQSAYMTSSQPLPSSTRQRSQVTGRFSLSKPVAAFGGSQPERKSAIFANSQQQGIGGDKLGRFQKGTKRDALQFGQIPQRPTSSASQRAADFINKRPRIGQGWGEGQKSFSQGFQHVQPAKQQSVERIPAITARPEPGSAVQAFGNTSRTSSIGTKDVLPTPAAALLPTEAEEGSALPQWTPMRQFAGLEERRRASGLKRERDATPEASHRRLKQRQEPAGQTGSAERRQRHAGATPYLPSKPAGLLPDTPDSLEATQGVPQRLEPSRDMTETARRIFRAIDAAATPPKGPAPQPEGPVPPPPSSSLRSSELMLPPSVILPLSASVGFDFSDKQSAGPRRGSFLAAKKDNQPAGFLAMGKPTDRLDRSKDANNLESGRASGTQLALPSSQVPLPAATTQAPSAVSQSAQAEPSQAKASTGGSLSFLQWQSTPVSGTSQQQSKASEPQAETGVQYTFGRKQTSEQKEAENRLEAVVKSASTAAEKAPVFAFGQKKEGQGATNKESSKVPALSIPSTSAPKQGFGFGAFKPSSQTASGGAGESLLVDAEKKNAESIQAAQVQLPASSESDEEPPSQQQPLGNGSLAKGNDPKKQEAPSPAPTWDLSFLKKNQAAAKKATDSTAEEIAKKNSPSPQPAGGISFGRSSAPASAADSRPLLFGNGSQAPSTSTFSFGMPKAEAQAGQSAGSEVPATPTLLAPADAEKQLSSSARPFQPIKWGVPDKAAGKENNEDANGSAPSTDAPAPFTFGALAHQPKATAAPQGGEKEDEKPKAESAAPSFLFKEAPSEPVVKTEHRPSEPAPIITKRQASSGSERAMSISPSVGAGTSAAAKEFLNNATPQSAAAPTTGASTGDAALGPSAPPFSFGTSSAPAPALPTWGSQPASSIPAFGAPPASSVAFPGPSNETTPSSYGAQTSGNGIFGGQTPATASFSSPQGSTAFGSQPSFPTSFGSQPGFAASSGGQPALGGAFGAPSSSAAGFTSQPALNFSSASNGPFAFGAGGAASASAQSAPGMMTSGFGNNVGFGASGPAPSPAFGSPALGTMQQPAQGTNGPFGSQAAGQAGSSAPFAAFGQQNGAPFGQMQAPAFGNQSQAFAFSGSAGMQQPGGGMTLGQSADPAILAQRKKVKAKRVVKK